MFQFLTLVWSRDSCSRRMSKEDQFPNVGFVRQAFYIALAVRFLLMHTVCTAGQVASASSRFRLHKTPISQRLC